MTANAWIGVAQLVVVLGYMGCWIATGVRLETLVRSGKAPESTPSFFGLFSAPRSILFIFSDRASAFGDAGLSRLVWLCRILFALIMLALVVSPLMS